MVSLNSSVFLKSVSSSELERKSIDDSSPLQLDFSMLREDEYELYDVFDPKEEEP